MYAQFFGNFLLSRNAVTQEQLITAIEKESTEHIKLGTLAIHAGYMSASEVDRIVVMQTHVDCRFGELAIKEGYLTSTQVDSLLHSQSPNFLLLGQILVDDGILDNKTLEALIYDYESENELYELDYNNEQSELVDRLLDHFFSVAQRPIADYELSFTKLLFNNLVRFIGEDFTPICPSPCKEYPSNYCISQRIYGPIELTVYLDMPETTCIAFASRYVGDTFTEFDEFVQSSMEDFLNLQNGLYNVNVSNDRAIELFLESPVVERDELLIFEKEAYLLPVIYPFGTLNFIFCLNSLLE